MNILQTITDELQVKLWQVEAAVNLIDEGNTIPFISRYRKEATGSLNDEQLRNLSERLSYLRNLEEKKASVLASIEEQGKLTEELRKQIEAAQTLVVERFVSSIPTKTSYESNDCKRKRAGSFGKCYLTSDDQPSSGSRCGSLY